MSLIEVKRKFAIFHLFFVSGTSPRLSLASDDDGLEETAVADAGEKVGDTFEDATVLGGRLLGRWGLSLRGS